MPQFKTVGELADYLATLPREAEIVIDGADIGGYDVTLCPIADVKLKHEFSHNRWVEADKTHVNCLHTGQFLFISGALQEREPQARYGDDWWDILKQRDETV